MEKVIMKNLALIFSVEVLEPKNLRKEIAVILRKTARIYLESSNK